MLHNVSYDYLSQVYFLLNEYRASPPSSGACNSKKDSFGHILENKSHRGLNAKPTKSKNFLVHSQCEI